MKCFQHGILKALYGGQTSTRWMDVYLNPKFHLKITRTRTEKWNVLCAWLPKVWSETGGDLNKVIKAARAMGFYGENTTDFQMLGSVINHLGLKQEAA